MVFTIGHSTRTIEEFLALLRRHGVATLVDVRRFPASRRYPHFNREALEATLSDAGIAYRWLPELGGRRKARPDSRNTRWRNESFRGYADYMETPEFGAAVQRLQTIAAGGGAAMMCSEALWWRCHRSLLSDYLQAHGIPVVHILGADKAEPHRYTEPARVVNGELLYGEDRLI